MPKMEVAKLVAHLIITLVLIFAYVAILVVKGYSDDTLKGAIFAVIGYWFGALGISSSKKGGKEDGNGF